MASLQQCKSIPYTFSREESTTKDKNGTLVEKQQICKSYTIVHIRNYILIEIWSHKSSKTEYYGRLADVMQVSFKISKLAQLFASFCQDTAPLKQC